METFSLVVVMSVMLYALGSLIISSKSMNAIKNDDNSRLRKLERFEKLYKNIGTTIILMAVNIIYIVSSEISLILSVLLIAFTLMVIISNAVFDYGAYFKKRIISSKVNISFLLLGILGMLTIVIMEAFLNY